MSETIKEEILIDLSKQFPFEIDDEKKKELCFSETLIISCVHGEGDIKESTDSEWSCAESTAGTQETKKIIPKINYPMPITPQDESEPDVEEDYEDFHFYFFPDCTIPHENDSRDSIIVKDGFPTVNLKRRGPDCICHEEREEICKCGAQNLLIKCICGSVDDICPCYPEVALPVCPSTCDCDKAFEEEHIAHSVDTLSFCGCPYQPKCSCIDEAAKRCTCFLKTGSDEGADVCKVCEVCKCVKPCVCDELPDPAVCTCTDEIVKEEDANEPLRPIHAVPEKPVKLKRKRAGKEGYRWCHEIDPKHTFFDYGYDRHDKVEYSLKKETKLNIMGLEKENQENEIIEEETVAKEGPKLQYQKKVREVSLDCCSAVGGITISVNTLGEDKNKFLIQVVSHFSKEGAKSGSKLISIVDSNLHTLEENRSEHITRNDLKKQRRSYMTICDSGYFTKTTRICDTRSVVKRIYHSFEEAHDFILEGANVVLLRYFAISNYKGRVITDTVLIDGNVCQNVYVCLGVSQSIVNGKPFYISKIERHIIEPTGFIHKTLTAMSLKGYIVSHEWADTNYIFHVNPLLRVYPETNDIESHEPLRENWRTDLQLLSDFMDFKSARTAEGGRYVSENGDLTAVIRDYLQALLLLRPQDALTFTQEYFHSAIGDLELAHNEFFQPAHKNVRYYFYED